MNKIILFFSFIVIQSCGTMHGKCCYNDDSISECIDLKDNKKFQYNYWIDTGESKGMGNYTIENNKLTLNFYPPKLKNESEIKITIEDSKLINISCVDFNGNKVFGAIEIRGNNGFYAGYHLRGDRTELKTEWIEFPATFTLDCLSYQKTSFELKEPSGYDINITLDDNRGFNITNEERSYKIISKKRKELTLEPFSKDGSTDSITAIKYRRVYERSE